MLLCWKNNHFDEAFQFIWCIRELGYEYSDGLINGISRNDYFSVLIDVCIKVKNHEFVLEILETTDWFSGKRPIKVNRGSIQS